MTDARIPFLMISPSPSFVTEPLPTSKDRPSIDVCEYITHVDTPEDEPFLRVPLFDVNMRLFKANKEYKAIVLSSCELIGRAALTHMKGYSLPWGTSGANLGLPFNIIAVVYNRATMVARAQVMINPHILAYKGQPMRAYTNCGSLRLRKSVIVERHPDVQVSWFDCSGEHHDETFNRAAGSFTIQHEVDHNRGVLITDRMIEEEVVRPKLTSPGLKALRETGSLSTAMVIADQHQRERELLSVY